MTPLPDKLRAALRNTADEIPAEAPPLQLSSWPAARRNGSGRDPRPGWRAWTAPLASAVLVVAVIAVSVALAVGVRHQPATSGQASPDGVPPYYVALTVPGTYTDIYTGGTARPPRCGPPPPGRCWRGSRCPSRTSTSPR